MEHFIGGLLLLAVGYLIYGRVVERILCPDDRKTPALLNPDGVDYVVLPHWKNMLIQLLNIAGIGPVIGVILGVKFGVIVFYIIPIGNIIAGAVHDFLGGMMSIRNNGANLPSLINMTLGKRAYRFFSVFTIFLLLLVVAVFINVPANLIKGMATGGSGWFWGAVVLIFLYYIAATMFPVDKIIGKIYPLFGILLLVGTLAIMVAVIISGFRNPELLNESPAFQAAMWTDKNQHPVLPLLFVTIACGIISGFHATQSPIVARTMVSERQAKPVFYGMMIVEGLIAMVWAAAGLVIYNLHPEFMKLVPAVVLGNITTEFLGSWMGGITVCAVIILAITSGDTAMRSLRLTLAESFHYDQKCLKNRFVLCLPLIILVAVLLIWSNKDGKSFNNLWNYFAWGNQVLAAFTLFAAVVWLRSQKKFWGIAALPGTFMTFIVISYILWISPAHGGPWGFGLSLEYALFAGVVLAILLMLNVITIPLPKELFKKNE